MTINVGVTQYQCELCSQRAAGDVGLLAASDATVMKQQKLKETSDIAVMDGFLRIKRYLQKDRF